ncbi:MAG TPA: hypothetical protein VGQ00_01355 [Candidatus Norongarragalinales archaeon]|jgi:hypothetical protein|nr:hypothetical protein [Candidatus Norongarragalinales archaeon]
MVDQKILAIAIILGAILVSAGLFLVAQRAAVAIQPTTFLAECHSGDIANTSCASSTLSWRACSSGRFISRSFDCAKLSEENRTGACQQARCVQLDAQGRVTQVFTPTTNAEENVTPTMGGVSAAVAGFLVVEPFSLGYCGDSYCDYKEDCSSCAQDCGCASNEYCHPTKRYCAPREACGDSICTNKERNDASCCTDCGCSAGRFCASGLETCQLPANITNATIDATVNSFITSSFSSSGLSYTFVSVFDDVYAGQSVKTAVLDCNKPGDQYVCRTLLVMLANGTTVKTQAN